MSDTQAKLSIRILEKEYHITCPIEERSDLLDSAEFLNAKMREIRDMSKTLRHLAEHCHGDDRPHCPIIESLSSGHEAGPARSPQKRRSPAAATVPGTRGLSHRTER